MSTREIEDGALFATDDADESEVAGKLSVQDRVRHFLESLFGSGVDLAMIVAAVIVLIFWWWLVFKLDLI